MPNSTLRLLCTQFQERRQSQRSKLGAFKECIKIYYKLLIYRICRIKTPKHSFCSLLYNVLSVLSGLVLIWFYNFELPPNSWPLLLPVAKVITLPWEITHMYVKIQLQYIFPVTATYNLWMFPNSDDMRGNQGHKSFFCQMPVSLGIYNLWRKRHVWKWRNWLVNPILIHDLFYHSVISWLWVDFLSMQRIQYPSRDIIIKWEIICKMLNTY